jgi:hypothetical protein
MKAMRGLIALQLRRRSRGRTSCEMYLQTYLLFRDSLGVRARPRVAFVLNMRTIEDVSVK